MKYFVVVVAAFFSVASAASLEGRIVGGQTAEDGQFPYLVSLRAGGGHRCGGSILNENYVLTAAHCVLFVPSQVLSVVVGTNKLDSEGDEYRVAKYIHNPNYIFPTLDCDIALVKLIEPIQFNDKVQPIQLETSFLGAGVDLVLSGWGWTSYPGSFPQNLQFIHLKSISTEDCKEQYDLNNANIDKTHICTLTRIGEGACNGDSGGPLVHDGKLAGIVSGGDPCALGVPDVFTRVSEYIDWINKNIK